MDRLRAVADGPSVSRNAYVTWLVEREVAKLTGPNPPAGTVPAKSIIVAPEPIRVPDIAETMAQRLERLREAAGLTQPALASALGISRGKYQRALAAGKLPVGAEAWMRAREGGAG